LPDSPSSLSLTTTGIDRHPANHCSLTQEYVKILRLPTWSKVITVLLLQTTILFDNIAAIATNNNPVKICSHSRKSYSSSSSLIKSNLDILAWWLKWLVSNTHVNSRMNAVVRTVTRKWISDDTRDSRSINSQRWSIKDGLI